MGVVYDAIKSISIDVKNLYNITELNDYEEQELREYTHMIEENRINRRLLTEKYKELSNGNSDDIVIKHKLMKDHTELLNQFGYINSELDDIKLSPFKNYCNLLNNRIIEDLVNEKINFNNNYKYTKEEKFYRFICYIFRTKQDIINFNNSYNETLNIDVETRRNFLIGDKYNNSYFVKSRYKTLLKEITNKLIKISNSETDLLKFFYNLNHHLNYLFDDNEMKRIMESWIYDEILSNCEKMDSDEE